MRRTPRRDLSNEIEIVDDFSVARTLSPETIKTIRSVISRSDKITIRRLYETVRRRRRGFSLADAERVLVCLQNCGTAKEEEPSKEYVDYVFRIDTQRATDVLEQQLIGSHACSESDGVPLIKPILTVPDEVAPNLSDRSSKAARTYVNIRRMLLEAEESVRLANPFFDAGTEAIEDLASVPNRNVSLSILTRQTYNRKGRVKDVLNSIYYSIRDEVKDLLRVAELYSQSHDTGHQLFATHAKILVVDDHRCYVGSANLTTHSLRNNFELGVLIEGDAVEDITEIFDDVFRAAEPIELPV